MDINMDVLGMNYSQGLMANHLLNNGSINPGALRPFMHNGKAYISVYAGLDKDGKKIHVNHLVNNATLKRDEWIALDQAVLRESRSRLVGIQDLITANLTYELGNGGMSTTVLQNQNISDAMEVELSMDGATRGKNDRPEYTHTYLPLPILHGDYEINARELAASRNGGNPLDTTQAEMVSRKISEKLENMLFTDTKYSFGAKDSLNRNTIYSYVNYPDRHTKVLAKAWNASNITAKEIFLDCLEMKQTLINDKMYGPYVIYIPTEYETILDDDYDTQTPGTTLRERILKISGITAIKVADSILPGNVVMVQMRPETVRLVRGLGIQNIQWNTEGGMITKFKVMTIQVPQIRTDAGGHCGIVHMATA